jgi:hypothetical protein
MAANFMHIPDVTLNIFKTGITKYSSVKERNITET